LFFNQKKCRKGRREDPELPGEIFILFLMRKSKKKGEDRIRSSQERFPYYF